MKTNEDAAAAFIRAAVWHGSLDRAEDILTQHPEIARLDIHLAAIVGDDPLVDKFLKEDRANATKKRAPLGWDALTHLCFSKYLRLDRSRSERFVRAAKALLDAGASANTGFFEKDHQPKPEWESALYGAAGVAHHPDLTRLLIERGADPNDGEVAYHTPEGYDNAALEVLLQTGKLTPDTLATMLLRKADWHDDEGIKLLLDHGADPNGMTHWGNTGLHQALRRDNALGNIELLLDHGADPQLVSRSEGRSAVAIAARRGRRDVLDVFDRRGFVTRLSGVEQLISACARDDEDAIRSMAERRPQFVREMLEQGGKLLAEFAGVGNLEGVRRLLDLGIKVDAPYPEGDGYFDIPKNSTALHVAAWRGRHATVKLLIGRGAAIDLPDENGRTALALAVRACVDSHWSDRRSSESVKALLAAGASFTGVPYPCGYEEVDQLLAPRRA